MSWSCCAKLPDAVRGGSCQLCCRDKSRHRRRSSRHHHGRRLRGQSLGGIVSRVQELRKEPERGHLLDRKAIGTPNLFFRVAATCVRNSESKPMSRNVADSLALSSSMPAACSNTSLI